MTDEVMCASILEDMEYHYKKNRKRKGWNISDIFHDCEVDDLAINYSHLSLEERCPKNLPFCTARAVAYVRFTNVVASQPRRAMHPEFSGCIDTPLVEVRQMLHLRGEGNKKAGGIGWRIMQT